MANSMFLRFATQRVVLSAVFVFCLLALIASFNSLPTKSTPPLQANTPSTSKPDNPLPTPVSPKSKSKSSRCDSLPNNYKNTLIIVKTGANEVYEKLPTQLLTALECYDENILIFSDLAQRIGHYPIYDALDNVTESIKKGAGEFEYYRTLQEYYKNRQEIATLKEKSGKAAWNLDKFKFLHMLEKTWKMSPDKKWYVFIEADTYLVQSNLFMWLERLDHTRALYMGSPTYISGDAFSHGGSGYILSGAALKKFADGDEGIAQRFDKEMSKEQFGDHMLMKALQSKGVEFSKVWPMLQAEKPSSLPFGPGPDNGIRHWCQPIVTMHHITSDEASRLWDFERKRKNVEKPLLIKELYLDFIAPYILPVREDWYNLSDDQQYRAPGVNSDRQKKPEDMSELEKAAYKSFEDCGKACLEQDRCYQYTFRNGVCGFSFSYRLGYKKEPEDGKAFKSGFAVEKIKKYAKENTCEVVEWLKG